MLPRPLDHRREDQRRREREHREAEERKRHPEAYAEQRPLDDFKVAVKMAAYKSSVKEPEEDPVRLGEEGWKKR